MPTQDDFLRAILDDIDDQASLQAVQSRKRLDSFETRRGLHWYSHSVPPEQE